MPPKKRFTTPSPASASEHKVAPVPSKPKAIDKPPAYCPECGTKFAGRAKYCANCGTPRDSEESAGGDVLTTNRKNKLSPLAIWILMFLSVGLFQVYWLYKQWYHLKYVSNLKVSPILRAILALFFTPSLFNRISDASGEKSYGSVIPYSIFFILLMVALNITSAATGASEGKAVGIVFLLGILAGQSAIMSAMQERMNKVWEKTAKRVTAPWSYFVIGIFLLIGLLSWVGVLTPPDPASTY